MAKQSVSRIPQNLWSFASFAAAAQTIGEYKTLFTAKLGDSGVTLNDTNFKTSSRVPYPRVTVIGIQAEIYNTGNVAKLPGLDMNALRQNVSFTLYKNTVKRVFAMLHNIPAGNDVTGAVGVGTATTTLINGVNGSPVASNYYMFKQPEVFTAQDQIEGRLTTEATWTVATAAKVRITLLAYIDQAQGIGA